MKTAALRALIAVFLAESVKSGTGVTYGVALQAVRRKLSLAIMVFAVAQGIAFADQPSPKLPPWVDRMVAATRAISFQGLLVYAGDGPLRAARVVHRRNGDEAWSRIISLNGDHRELRRIGDVAYTVYPEHGVVVPAANDANFLAFAISSDLTSIEKHYGFQLLDRSRVAGRPCQQAAVAPKDEYRFGYRLCLDLESGLLLDAQLLDDHGQVRRQLSFVELEVGGQGLDAFAPPELDDSWEILNAIENVGERRAEGHGGQWRVRHVPPGFEEIFQGYRPISADSVAPTAHLVLSDGLASVSVYITPSSPSQPVWEGRSQRRAANAYGTVRDGHQIAAIGEVPYKALELIADSVYFDRQESGDD